jgi:hypothetical protein
VRLLQWCWCSFQSSGIWWCVEWIQSTNILRKLNASNFRGAQDKCWWTIKGLETILKMEVVSFSEMMVDSHWSTHCVPEGWNIHWFTCPGAFIEGFHNNPYAISTPPINKAFIPCCETVLNCSCWNTMFLMLPCLLCAIKWQLTTFEQCCVFTSVCSDKIDVKYCWPWYPYN